MKTLLNTALVGALALSATALTAEEPSETYALSMTITDNGRLVASPNLTIRFDEPVDVEIDHGDGASYRASMVFSEESDGRVSMDAAISFDSPTSGKADFNPKLKIAKGEPARIEYGNQAPGVRPFRMEIMISDAAL